MRVADFDYHLPPDLVAQEPLPERDASRLLVLHRALGRWEHRAVRDLPLYLRAGDCLVLNDTRVLPARLTGRRATGGRVEVLLLRKLAEGGGEWEALVRPARRLRPGEVLHCDGGDGAEAPALTIAVRSKLAEGRAVVVLEGGPDAAALIRRYGTVPLPPYIKKPLADPERYQTVYARAEGSAAAPTAGLHFTPRLLRAIEERGVRVVFLTLHVGIGTFRPVTVEAVEDHRMHPERFLVPEETARAVNEARRAGGRVIAVGTTAARALEAAADGAGLVRPAEGETDLFIRPGYRFRAVDGLLTNFHLPRSTLLMLVAAFAGLDLVLAAYRDAVRERYRFFSFGDAMLIL